MIQQSIGNEKLKFFMSAVNRQIDDRMSKLISEAEEQKRLMLKSAEKYAKEKADAYYRSEIKKHSSQYVRELSKATIDMKRSVHLCREELTNELFINVEKKLLDFRSSSPYVDYLVKSLLLANISGEAEVFLSPEDMQYEGILKKAVPADTVTIVPDKSIRLGGLVIYRKSKGTVTDKTFDQAIKEQRRSFANSGAIYN